MTEEGRIKGSHIYTNGLRLFVGTLKGRHSPQPTSFTGFLLQELVTGGI